MALNDKIALLRLLWNDIQGELFANHANDERVNEASDDITFAVAMLPVYLGRAER